MIKNYFAAILFLICSSAFAQKPTAIFDVARSGTLAEVKTLFQQNPKVVNEINDAGYSPLILACYRGNNEVAKFLINNGAEINYNNAMGTALMAAVVKGNVEIATLLILNKADVNSVDANKTTALIYAVQFKNTPITKLLLEHQADKTKIDINGKTAFEYAVFSGNQEIINLLK
jgi:hypothetical protein